MRYGAISHIDTNGSVQYALLWGLVVSFGVVFLQVLIEVVFALRQTQYGTYVQ